MNEKTRDELEAMSKSELLRYAAEQNIEIPGSYRKPEIIDAIMAWEDSSEQTTDEIAETDEAEKPPHVIEHERRAAELEKLVALSAVEHAKRDAAAKAAKKQFESLRDTLSDHLMEEPTPTLFDNEDGQKCRECNGEPSDDKVFVDDDLCQVCADNLGKEQDETTEAVA